jgi:DNA-binding transcriptional ArsR family regulator
MIQRDLSLYVVKAQVLSALANPRRLEIVDRLAKGEKTVSQLAAVLGVAQAATSQHLAVMRMAGVVDTRRVGNRIYYRLSNPGLATACRQMSQVVVAILVSQRERLRPVLLDGDAVHPEVE